ncbi:hypothetical protein ZOSMA_259G00070 [Zostera marina]|uniref:Uncharacterized protein n=1 Tax=Zostera marina TaxID=29655 RepID=A0A0K9PFR0_ZOSMR|nr:hypothetical protein ZOSMA_259G00070 [Zostera marina]
MMINWNLHMSDFGDACINEKINHLSEILTPLGGAAVFAICFRSGATEGRFLEDFIVRGQLGRESLVACGELLYRSWSWKVPGRRLRQQLRCSLATHSPCTRRSEIRSITSETFAPSPSNFPSLA